MNVVSKAVASIEPVDADSDGGSGEFDLILSAQTLDRDGDVLKADEWKTPLPDHVVMDIDHGMSVASTVGSGTPFINEDGNLQVRGTFASTPLAQEVRTLVRERHIRTASVSFMTDKSVKDGKPSRELLNGAFVAVPSNRESVVLSAKAFDAIAAEAEHKAKKDDYDGPWADPGYLDSEGKPAKDGNGQPRYKIGDEETARAAWSYINMPKNADQYTAEQLKKIKDKIEAACRKFGIEISEDSDDKKSLIAEEVLKELSVLLAETKAGARNSTTDQRLIQTVHNASTLLGAECHAEAEPEDVASGASEGANKSVTKSAYIVGKSLNGSLEDMQSRLQDALCEAAGCGDYGSAWPWIIATYMNPDGNGGSVVYRQGGETLCRAFSDDGSCVALDSNIQVVTVITSVAPVPDTVDGDRVMLPPAAADAAKSVKVATVTTESAGGFSALPALTDEAMDMEQFKAALDSITATQSSGPAGSGSPAEPATDVDAVSPDSKAASKDPAYVDESADDADEEAAEADTPNDDESQEKQARMLRMRILASNMRAESLAS